MSPDQGSVVPIDAASRRPRRSATSVADVVRRVLDHIDELIPQLGAAYRAGIPEYAALTDEDMEREVLATSRAFVEEFLTRTMAGAGLEGVDLAAIGRAGRRRLEMGVSLDSALHAFRIAGRESWTAVVAVTEDDEQHLLAELAMHWLDYVDRASSAFAESYLAASHEHLRLLDARRRVIVDALLDAADAGDVAAVAARYSVTVARSYTPVVFSGPGVSARIDRVLQSAPRDSVAGARGDRVLLLVPGPHDDLDAVVAAAGPGLVAHGRPAAPGPALLDEVHLAERLLEVATLAGREGGRFGPDDLLVEQLLNDNERVAATLHRLVTEPLSAHDPDGIFTSTLRAYLDCGSIPETARREVVHVNTVSYRLKRVRDLTGFDPRIPAQAAVLVLATATTGGPE